MVPQTAAAPLPARAPFVSSASALAVRPFSLPEPRGPDEEASPLSTEHGELFARTWRIAATGYPSRATLDDLVEQLLPQIEALDGYLGGNILVDRDHGDILATTFWDSMESLTAAQARATNAAAGTLVISDGAGIQISVCDVLVSTPVPCLVNRELGGRPA